MNEEWKDIKDFEGCYQVSSKGRVRSLDRKVRTLPNGVWHTRTIKGRLLSLKTQQDGYIPISMCRGNESRRYVRIHTLVLEAFVGAKPNGFECCHRDGDRANNDISNLYWGTSTQNAQDRKKHPRDTIGERHGMAKLTAEEVATIRKEYIPHVMPAAVLAERFGISRSHTYGIIHNKFWKEF